MAEPFKDGINERVVRHYADALGALVPGFDGPGFLASVMAELGALELKARVQLISARLWAHLGPDYPKALGALMTLLDAAEAADGPAVQFTHWPMAQFIEDHGVDHLAPSVAAMKRITRHFSCEFAVRPFLVRYPDAMLQHMHAWAQDPDLHVRRNASEGIRPRLPWGLRLTAFVADPTPVFAVLERLRKDPEEYVRRSVSNCLNDIAKDHPQRLMDVLEAWDADPDAHSAWIKKRALRTLVKAGDPRALALLGFAAPKVRVEGLAVDAPRYSVGDTLTIRFTVVSEASEPQAVVIDYRVHYMKANGRQSPKVFKLKNVTLGPGERLEVVRRQHLKPISTRRFIPGTHAVDVQVSGQTFEAVAFELNV